MTARLIDFCPTAWAVYQNLRLTGDGLVIRHALEQIASESALLAAEFPAVRYQVIEEQLPRPAEIWGLSVDGLDSSHWLIVWREYPYVVEIGHIGVVPAVITGIGTS